MYDGTNSDTFRLLDLVFCSSPYVSCKSCCMNILLLLPFLVQIGMIVISEFLCGVCVGLSWFLCSFAEFVLADLGFCVPLWSLCWLILVFVFLCGVCVGWSWFLCSFVKSVYEVVSFVLDGPGFLYLCWVWVDWSWFLWKEMLSSDGQ